MTFKQQVSWARKRGALLLVAAGVIWVAILLLASMEHLALAKFGAILEILVMAIASVLLLFGGLMRPLQKQFYHYALEGNEVYRLRMGNDPIMKRWLWLDGQGRDLDHA